MTPPRSTMLSETTPSDRTAARAAARRSAKPVLVQLPDSKIRAEHIALGLFVIVPFLAVLGAIPMLWGKFVSITDIVIAVVMYYLTGHGITVGFHRYFTHGSFKAKRPMRLFLAITGSMAIEGPVVRWVADHRRHHAFSDKEGDPHSPWRYGESLAGLTKGFWHAHLGWMFDAEKTNPERFAPDLLADRAIVRISKGFGGFAAISLLLPPLIGGLVSMSWLGAATAFFWGSLVRVFVLHHTTWSVNSVCHIFGERPFNSRDKAANFWPMALLAMGENWHNWHHADPTSARHGALRGQLDSSARLIWLFEKCGWVSDVRWPTRERLAAKLAST